MRRIARIRVLSFLLGGGFVVAPACARAQSPTVAAIPVASPVASPGLSSVGGTTLGAFETVTFALEHSPSLLAQRATVATQDSMFQADRAAEYPALKFELQNQLSKQANASGQFAQFGVSPQNVFSENTLQFAGSYNLYNGSAQLVAEQAYRAVRSASYELERQRERTVANVARAFFALAENRNVIELDRQDLAYQNDLLDSAQAQFHVGRVAGVDVLRAQVAVARSSSALVQAQTDLANAREALAVQIGAPVDTAFAIPDVLPEPAAPALSQTESDAVAQKGRPEIAEARETLAAARLADAAIDSDLRPTFALTAAFGSQVTPTSFAAAQQRIDATNLGLLANYNQEKTFYPNAAIAAPMLLPNVDRHVPGFWQIGLVATFAVPLYDYGERASAHHAARAQIDSSYASLYNAFDVVRADVDESRRNLAAASERLAFSKESAGLARETARIAQLQYRNGLISFTDATQTEQNALTAANDLVTAGVSYVTAYVNLRVALAPRDVASAVAFRDL